MMRRQFLAGLLAASSAPVFAQTGARVPRIGWISAQQPAALAPYVEALRSALAEQGYVEGKSIAIEYRYGNDALDKVPSLIQDLLGLPIDLLVAQGAAAFEAVKLQLPVPMVYVISADPVSAGFADSLARPRGNKTGLTFMAFEFAAKRLEILKEIIPNLKTVSVIGNPEHPGANLERAYSEETARVLGIAIDYAPTPNKSELDKAFLKIEREKPQAISLLADGFAIQNRKTIIDFATSQRIPVISGWPVFARSGALCTYGPKQSESYSRLAHYIARVLKGAKPSDLPVERPTKFEMVINLQAAQALGVTVPPSVLARADDIISA